jgi:hypothetical protein
VTAVGGSPLTRVSSIAGSTIESLASSWAPFVGPTIAALAREHIDLLTGIRPNARACHERSSTAPAPCSAQRR